MGWILNPKRVQGGVVCTTFYLRSVRFNKEAKLKKRLRALESVWDAREVVLVEVVPFGTFRV